MFLVVRVYYLSIYIWIIMKFVLSFYNLIVCKWFSISLFIGRLRLVRLVLNIWNFYMF